MLYGVLVHGGAGSPGGFSEGCREACEAAFGLLTSGRSALEAAVEAVRILEDDGRFNAGRGSALRLDGRTREMDAGVMDSGGNMGAVIAIRDVRNPVLVARAVMKTPHLALAGQGAMLFAKKLGFPPLGEASSYARERYEKMKRLIKEGRPDNPRWKGYNIEELWNFDTVSYGEVFASDTVGAVALDKQGVLAAAVSTGGAPPMMLGRVGDCPMAGCGFYAGPACAVAVTGTGEEIIKGMLAKVIYDMVREGQDLKAACGEAIGRFHPGIAVGAVAISKDGSAALSNREMAHFAMTRET
jgi:beta-aspartyl-peptidase (threonine type)